MKNIQAQYIDLLEGKMSKANFMRNVRMQFPQYVSPVTSYEDSVSILKGKRILSEAKKPEGVYGHNPSAEVTKYPNFDITDENLVLAKEKALKALTKDPMAYRELMIANQKAITEMDKDLKMKDVKGDNKVDKANGMKVVKKDAPASANQSAKFTRKVEKAIQMTQTPKKVKGVEVMEVPGKEKVMALKEAILRELGEMEKPEHFNQGDRVMTKDKKKVGEIEKIEHDTATVKLDDGTREHIQLNVLTSRDVPEKQEKATTDEAVIKPGQWDTHNYPSKDSWDAMSEEERFQKMIDSSAADKFGEKQLRIRAKDDYDTLTKYNPAVKQAMAFPKKGVDGDKKDKIITKLKELLFKNKKTGQVQSFDQNHPEDKETMKDPQFNQVFQRAV